MAKLSTRLLQQRIYELHARRLEEMEYGKEKSWRYMPYGTQRRVLLLAHLRNVGDIPVNNKWQLNTAYDMDIKKLLKKGVLVMVKEGMIGKRQTWIRLRPVAA